MIELRHNEDGYVSAYADYRIVNKDGNEEKGGEYAYVKECWVHKSLQNGRTLVDLVRSSHSKNPQVKWIYYRRRKYGGKMKLYPIERFYEK